MTDYTKLREAAEAACADTRPWFGADSMERYGLYPVDAHYVSHADPRTILALLDRLSHAERAVTDASAELDKLKQERGHTKSTLPPNIRYSITWMIGYLQARTSVTEHWKEVQAWLDSSLSDAMDTSSDLASAIDRAENAEREMAKALRAVREHSGGEDALRSHVSYLNSQLERMTREKEETHKRWQSEVALLSTLRNNAIQTAESESIRADKAEATIADLQARIAASNARDSKISELTQQVEDDLRARVKAAEADAAGVARLYEALQEAYTKKSNSQRELITRLDNAENEKTRLRKLLPNGEVCMEIHTALMRMHPEERASAMEWLSRQGSELNRLTSLTNEEIAQVTEEARAWRKSVGNRFSAIER